VKYFLQFKLETYLSELSNNWRDETCGMEIEFADRVRGDADGCLALDENSRPFHTFLAASLLREAVMGNILVVPTYGNAITQYLAVSS
jgi:hypothetical protein